MHRRLAILTVGTTILALCAQAQVPAVVGHQGRLVSSGGQAVDGVLSITFELSDSASGGSSIWIETQDTSISDGFYSVRLGALQAFPQDAWSGADRWLQVTIGGEALVPRLAFSSVPFAIASNTALRLAGSSGQGQGSGLDADLLDGRDSSHFASDADLASLASDLRDEIQGLVASLASHGHDAADIESGKIDIARLPVGPNEGQVAPGIHRHAASAIDGPIDAATLGSHDADYFTPVATFLGVDLRNHARNGAFNWWVSASGVAPAFWAATHSPLESDEVERVSDGHVSHSAVRLWSAGTRQFGIWQDVFVSGTIPPYLLGEKVVVSLWAKKTARGTSEGMLRVSDSAGGTPSTVALGSGTAFHDVKLVHTLSSSADYLRVEIFPVASAGEAAEYLVDGVMVTAGELVPSFRLHPADDRIAQETYLAGSVHFPLESCKAIKAARASAPSGVYWIDPDGQGGNPPFAVHCDMTTDNGGWTLILSYSRGSNANSPLVPGVVPLVPAGYSHMSRTQVAALSPFTEVRFYCQTQAHGRYVNFKTANSGAVAFVRGTGDNSTTYWSSGFTALSTPYPAHNANIPADINSVTSSTSDYWLTSFTFYKNGNYHWGVRGGGHRWECDDFPNSAGNATLHNIWVR